VHAESSDQGKEHWSKSTATDGERVARIGAIKPRKLTKRWYEHVHIHKRDGKFEIALDERRLQTPVDNRLRIPSHKLAFGVAHEWMKQGESIRPASMPLMQLSCTAIDRIPDTRHMVVGMILEHLHTDTICCRAIPTVESEPLLEEQKRVHDPIMQWFREHFRVPLHVLQGPVEAEQPQDTVTVLQWHLHKMDDWSLAGLDVLISSSLLTRPTSRLLLKCPNCGRQFGCRAVA